MLKEHGAPDEDVPALCLEFLDFVPSMRKGKTLDAG